MKFYIFDTIDHNRGSILEQHGFDGVLLTYRIAQGDYFTKVAVDCYKNKNIKYLVAVRPYTISPQYLYMINKSLKTISNDRLQINLITGHIHENEKTFGGILSDINDQSSNIERSNYLIKYTNLLNSLTNELDFYVSTTNDFIFEALKDTNKLIISYGYYLKSNISLKNLKNIILSINPVLRKTKEEINSINKNIQRTDTVYFTHEEFTIFLNNLKNNNIETVLIDTITDEDKKEILQFVKQYKEKNG